MFQLAFFRKPVLCNHVCQMWTFDGIELIRFRKTLRPWVRETSLKTTVGYRHSTCLSVAGKHRLLQHVCVIDCTASWRGVICRTQTLSPQNLNVFRPQKQLFWIWTLLLSDLKTRLWFSWPQVFLTFTTSHSYAARDRIIMILLVRYLLCLRCWPGSSQNQPLQWSFSTMSTSRDG